MKHPILKKRTPGQEGIASAPFDVALSHAWDFDAYVVQYTGAVRLNKSDVASTPMHMAVELYDFDTPGHEAVTSHVDWAVSALERLPEGFQGCLTAGGFRVWTLRETPYLINDGESWETWRAYHAGRAEALGKAIGAEPDHATDDPGRLFRLPNVQREDGKPCYPELVGDLGIATMAALPWAVRSATEVSAGPALDTFLGQLFAQLGGIHTDGGEKLTVQCPWAEEHSGDSLAVVYSTEDGIGKFHCGHTHCAGRFTNDVIEKRRGLAPELYARWLLASQPEAPSEAPAQPVKDSPVWVTGEALAAPVGPVSWLVEALELAGGRAPIISADSGAGKSWSVQSIALSVASGMPVFGAFACRPGAVLHIAEDSDLDAVRDRYQRLARGMGLALADLPLAVYGRQFRVTKSDGSYDPTVLEKIRETARKQNAALVIFDSLATICVGLDENSPEIALPLYGSRDPRVCMLWTHHTPKSGEGYRGSSAIKAAAGAMWGMSTEGETRVWKSDKHAERTDKKNRLEGFSTTWDGERISVVESTGGQRGGAERPVDRAQMAMLRLLEEQGKADKATLLRAAGGSNRLNRAVFDFLANPLGGQITQVERGRFKLSAGVAAPKHAHDLKVTLPDSVIKEVLSGRP